MNLSPTSEQAAIFSTADGIFAELFPLSRFGGRDEISTTRMAANWRRMGELGLLGTCVSTSNGGSGLTLVEQALVCEALGRRVGPLELISTMLAAELAFAGGELPLGSALIRGEHVAGVLFPEFPDTHNGLESGANNWTAYGYEHTTVFLFSSPGMAGTFETESLTGTWHDCLATDLAVAREIRLPEHASPAAVSQAFTRGTVLMAAVLVGLSQSALEMAVNYAKTRVQFGAPIGVNQAIRHPCAEIAVKTKLARSQLYHAALTVEAQLSNAAEIAAYAKVLASDVALESCSNNIQFHGGIGLTDDFPAHVLLKMTHIAENWFGASEYHLAHIMKDD